MRRILLPLVETERSLLALQYVKRHFAPGQAEIILVMVDEDVDISAKREEEEQALAVLNEKLDLIGNVLSDYQVTKKGYIGKAGQCIAKVAREYNADYVVMTKSAQPDMLSMVGKTTEYVINNVPCNVLIISENKMESGEYRGLVYRKAQATVNLRGQIGDKQSECLLPSVNADCIYHFDVTVGKIRFFHTAYNTDTRNWDLPPAGDQEASIDIVAGESADILVKANSTEGKADRIRIINRGMKQEAVFSYRISVAPEPEVEEEPIEEAVTTPASETVVEEAVAVEAIAEQTPAVEEVPEVIEEVIETVEEAPVEVEETVFEPDTEETSVEEPVIEEPVIEEPVEVAEEPIVPISEPVYEEPEAAMPVNETVDEMLEAMPEPEPIEEVTAATIERDFDALFEKFKTAQMEYVEENPIELDEYL